MGLLPFRSAWRGHLLPVDGAVLDRRLAGTRLLVRLQAEGVRATRTAGGQDRAVCSAARAYAETVRAALGMVRGASRAVPPHAPTDG